MIRLPSPLRPGARVGVFAPSHPYAPERLERGLALIRSWGLEPVAAPNLGARWRHYSGTDAQRLEDLTWALTDPSLQACWMARGGSGLPRILSGVPWAEVPVRPALGFSDGTALHLALRQRAGIAGLHAPVLHSLADHVDEASLERLKALLFHGEGARLEGELLRKGRAEGPLVGGNLCIIASLCGGPAQLDARGCVLMLEDVDEPPYKLERLLLQLKDAGVFEGVAGVALGSFSGTRLPEGADYRLLDLLLDHVGDLGVPVLAGLPIGHAAENHAVVHGGFTWFEGATLRQAPLGVGA